MVLPVHGACPSTPFREFQPKEQLLTAYEKYKTLLLPLGSFGTVAAGELSEDYVTFSPSTPFREFPYQ